MASTVFDEIIDRQQYPTQKWNPHDLKQHFGSEDVLPFWIADMDFSAPQVIVENLMNRAQQGIYGYEYRPDSFFESVINWYVQRHQWTIARPHIQPCPGVLSAIAILINQHSEEGDGIIVQPPVFFEFRLVIRKNGRRLSKNPLRLVKNPLRLVDGRYQMDFDDLETKAADPRNKILILCNPHNPIGRVWKREELAQVDEICRKHNVRVISDEIHGDIVYRPYRYVPFASLSEAAAQNAFICLSPAKTFNLAGMIDGMVLIANDEYRQQYDNFADRYQINRNNVFSTAAIEIAYREGASWLDALLAYLQRNIDFVGDFLEEHNTQVKLVEPEGTYLVWLDFNELGLEAGDLARFLAQEAGLALNSGFWFGREGAGFMRMNIASPRSILEEAMMRLKRAVEVIR
jgi:cystathionine beta-lyase